MGFAFGNTTDMGFVKAINFMFIGFVLKQDAQGTGFVDKDKFVFGASCGPIHEPRHDRWFAVSGLPSWPFFSAPDFSGSMPDEGVGG